MYIYVYIFYVPGPVHSPVFTMAVEVNGTTYEGSGSTKKKAKLNAAEKALASFVQFPNASEAAQALGRPIYSGDFTSDVTESSSGALFNNFDPSRPREGMKEMWWGLVSLYVEIMMLKA